MLNPSEATVHCKLIHAVLTNVQFLVVVDRVIKFALYLNKCS